MLGWAWRGQGRPALLGAASGIGAWPRCGCLQSRSWPGAPVCILTWCSGVPRSIQQLDLPRCLLLQPLHIHQGRQHCAAAGGPEVGPQQRVRW